MNNFAGIRTSTNNETYDFELIPRKENSPYEYDYEHTTHFKGRPADKEEKSSYRLQVGVNVNNDSLYIFVTNLPEEIKPGDKIRYLGKTETVESIGYYYELNGIVNASLFSDEYIIARCPKGLTINRG